MAGTFDLEMVLAGLHPLLRPWNGFAPAKVRARDGRFAGHDLFWRAVGHDHAAFKASPWTEVAQPIRLTKGVFVVLNHE